MARPSTFRDEIDEIYNCREVLASGSRISRGSFRNHGTMNSVNLLAKTLREYHASENPDIYTKTRTRNMPRGDGNELEARETGENLQSRPSRCNNTFHYLRYVVVLMMGIALNLVIMVRYNITLSLLQMVNHTHLYLEEHPNRTVNDYLAEGYTLGGDFNWNNKIVAIILSWYMITHTIPQIPCTQLALKIGCRKSVLISLVICAISQLVTPAFAWLGWQYVVLTRLLNGLGAAPMNALALHVIDGWMRPKEVPDGLAIIQLILALAMFEPLLIGYLAEINWVYSFYYPGVGLLIFAIIWFLVVADKPTKSSFISERELNYLNDDDTEQGPANGSDLSRKNDVITHRSQEDDRKTEVTSRAWVRLLKVPSFYAHLINWTIYHCVNNVYIFTRPAYLRQFLKIGVRENGYYGLLTGSGTLVPVIWPHLLLKLFLKLGLSLTNSRRILQTICCTGVATTLIYLGTHHDNQILVFFLCNCFFDANITLIPGALMANFAKTGLSSVAFAIMNSVAHILIVPATNSIGWILDYTGQSRECWSWIFITLGLSHIVLWFIYIVFNNSEPLRMEQPKMDEKDIEQQNSETA